MTDDLIEAVARAIDHELTYLVERGTLACDLTTEEQSQVARAAIRAAAPLILDMAADLIDGHEVAFVGADGEYGSYDPAADIRQLKERFQ